MPRPLRTLLLLLVLILPTLPPATPIPPATSSTMVGGGSQPPPTLLSSSPTAPQIAMTSRGEAPAGPATALAAAPNDAILPLSAPEPAPVALAAVQRVRAEGGSFTEEEARAVLVYAGVPAPWLEPLLAIAWCESRWSPAAVGDNGRSHGWFQMWSGWARGGEDLYDPVTAAQVAVRVRESRGRFGGPGGWSCGQDDS